MATDQVSTTEPNVRLKLSNRPENVSLVRAMLVGVAEATELDPRQLDDIRTAVTEACNNAVLHAYGGAEGPIEIDVRLDAGSVAVAVRDSGIGLEPPNDRPWWLGEESLKLGLPVIQALAGAVELRRPAGGGTEVCMEFATPGSQPPDPGSEVNTEAPAIALLPALGNANDGAELIAAITIAIAPDRLARAVLPRLVCALAARASFSTDRLSDAQLVADVVATEAFAAITGTHLGVGITVEPRRVRLRVGPLPGIDGKRETAADATLCELGGVATRLIDDHSIAPVGSAAVLALQLIDQR
ncbi:MAG TPA: ATP-binding protein [Solirubrobacteraceae bacterium]